MPTTRAATASSIEFAVRVGAVANRVATDEPKSSSPRFGRILGLLVLFGVAIRLAFVTAVTFPGLATDAAYFRLTATNLAHGRGYSAPFVTHPHELVPTAAHPPLFPALLSVFDLLGIQSVDAQRIALAVVSATSVLVMGLLGRKIAGPTVGIVAAIIVAIDPLWLQPVGTLMSESIYLIVIPLMLLLALRCLETPTNGRFALLGAVTALTILVRSEAIDFVVLLGLPLLLFAAVPWKKRALLAMAFVAGIVVLLGPWVVRNEVQIGGAVISDQQGVTLAGSYCTHTFDSNDATYGSFSGFCADALAAYYVKVVPPPNPRKGWTELELDRSLTGISETFARQHLGRLPSVVLAREASTWGLGNHAFQMDLAVAGGRNRSYEQVGWVMYWILLPFVLVGAATLAKRSRQRCTVMVVPIVVVVLNVALTYGSTRFRIAAEPSLAALAALGLVAVVERVRRFFPTSRLQPAGSADLPQDPGQLP